MNIRHAAAGVLALAAAATVPFCPGCQGAGFEVSDVAEGALVALYGQRVHGRLWDYVSDDVAGDFDPAEALESALLLLAEVDQFAPDADAREKALAGLELARKVHDGYVAADPNLSEPERARALMESARLVALARGMLIPAPPAEPESEE